MQGVTPPHIYELKPREALFHGVPALRLTPVGGEDKIFGRDGLLAHTYMISTQLSKSSQSIPSNCGSAFPITPATL